VEQLIMTTNSHKNNHHNHNHNHNHNHHNQPKNVYIPYMCDHTYTTAAAMRAHNLPAEVLEPTTEESLAYGLHFCKGRECLPCLSTTGDILHRARQPDFDPSRSAVFMPTTSGSCRFGNYNVLQQTILQEEGLGDVEFLMPSADNAYHGFGKKTTQLRLLIWQGAVAGDLLHKLLHQYRPYERNKGQTDQVYQQCLERLVVATEKGGGKELVGAMRWAARQFEMIPVEWAQRRPLIGVVGEIYIRFNKHINLDIARQIELLGGEAHISTIIEWLYFTNWYYKKETRDFGKPFEYLKMYLTDWYQRHLEHNLLKPVSHLLRHAHETHTDVLMRYINPYYHPDLTSEAILSMGSAIDFANRGYSGIINIMPFSCMPGIITAGMAPRLRVEMDNIPWLDISYDAQAETNIKTRLEAFIYQAFQFQRRRTKVIS
jgi:predicted nucleotide-binding protein (sugar kinase/HSP70/actin superfamily)